MNRLMYYTFPFILLFVFSCKHHHGKVDHPMYDEVMAVHDEVMPKMKNIHSLKKELKSLKNTHPDMSAQIVSTIGLLERSDDGMMDWMAEFKVPEDKTSIESYLKSEKTKIQKVSDDMYQAMNVAQKLIDSLNLIQ